ncbi:Abi family protein [Streptococcus mutans]|uniref:Abi family protein n=1 Tax=Streptococcus mutans TaxID=1309 RepID=UPI0038BD7CC1
MSKQKKLNNVELVNHLEEKGITFRNISKGQAITFIDKTNYYYKIAAFRKNFKKRDGKYIDLDFEYLKDLASIDMQIRNLLFSISINTEHFIKTEISRLINNNSKENGYNIIKEFQNSKEYKKYYNLTKKKFKQSRYQHDMYEKRKKDYPYWALLEHMDYGCLIKFIKFYYSKYKNKSKSLKKAVELGDNARYIRNACAHNSVFIINVFEENSKLNNVNANVTTLAKQIGVYKFKNYKKVNDLLSLCALSKAYCSKPVLEYQRKDLDNFLERCYRNKDYYRKNLELTKMITVFEKIQKII